MTRCNLFSSIFWRWQAKELRRLADRVVTIAKEGVIAGGEKLRVARVRAVRAQPNVHFDDFLSLLASARRRFQPQGGIVFGQEPLEKLFSQLAERRAPRPPRGRSEPSPSPLCTEPRRRAPGTRSAPAATPGC